ncbi:(d)CMP kinase [Robbsia sp. Bb-Pol-6]|uniref:Cytidylate kinase n=1 Tax=Robbsia betulipollinis TaxID=2981849 RepID=A0ABT3ZQ05_9BURK|nr:(d)CMP kinase [Robbsia betulipollinis]
MTDAVGHPVVTIDGPTASGKGTVASRVAAVLGFHLLDSGALYRLTALASARQGVAADDAESLAGIAATLDIRFTGNDVVLDGCDVSHEIRAEAIGLRASAIAVHGPVRNALFARQRAFREAPGLVADGRDMGTVIFPDARLKVFLTASVEARAARRLKQLSDKGFSANMDDLLKDLRERDARDTARTVAPLKPAADAFLLDTSEMSIETAVDAVIGWYRRSA